MPDEKLAKDMIYVETKTVRILKHEVEHLEEVVKDVSKRQYFHRKNSLSIYDSKWIGMFQEHIDKLVETRNNLLRDYSTRRSLRKNEVETFLNFINNLEGELRVLEEVHEKFMRRIVDRGQRTRLGKHISELIKDTKEAQVELNKLKAKIPPE